MSNVIPLSGSNQPIFVLQVRPSPKPGAVKAYADIQYHLNYAQLSGIGKAERKQTTW